MVGYFTASGVSQNFTFSGNAGEYVGGSSQVNALQVRDVTNIGYWQGISSNWDASTTRNFSTTTGGSAGTFAAAAAILPTVYFADTKTYGGAAVGTSTVNIAAGGVTGADVFFINNSVPYTLTGSGTAGITGAASVYVQGGGLVTFAGGNSYSGGTTISGGTLQVANAAAVQNSTVMVNVNNGLGLAANTLSIGGLAGSGGVTLNNGVTPVSLTVGSNGASTTYSGVLGGSGRLTMAGTGALTLTNSSTYTGPTAVNAGTLVVNGSIVSPVTINNGGTLVAGSATAFGGSLLTLNGGTLQSTIGGSNPMPPIPNRIQINAVPGNTLNAPTNYNLDLSGNLIGSGTVTKTGAYSVDLSGNNGAFAGTYINAASNTYFSGPNAGSALAAWMLFGGNLVSAVTGSQGISLGALQGTSGQLASDTGGSGVTFTIGDLGTSTTFSGTIVDAYGGSGTTAVVKTGSGMLTLGGLNTYSGGTTINGGTLAFAYGGLASNGSITFANPGSGATLMYAPGNTQDISARLKNSTAQIIIDTNGQDVIFESAIDNTNSAGMLIENSARNYYTGNNSAPTVGLSLANNFTGGLTIGAAPPRVEA